MGIVTNTHDKKPRNPGVLLQKVYMGMDIGNEKKNTKKGERGGERGNGGSKSTY